MAKKVEDYGYYGELEAIFPEAYGEVQVLVPSNAEPGDVLTFICLPKTWRGTSVCGLVPDGTNRDNQLHVHAGDKVAANAAVKHAKQLAEGKAKKKTEAWAAEQEQNFREEEEDTAAGFPNGRSRTNGVVNGHGEVL